MQSFFGAAGHAGDADPVEERRAAEQAALRILGGAAQSEASLRRRLERRGFSPEAAEAASTSAVRLGYVDDAALARSIVSRRRTRRGTARIAAELRSRGVDEATLHDALAGVTPDEQRSACLAEAQRRLRGALPTDPAERRRTLARIGAALSRLGFPSDAVAHALRHCAAAEPDEA